MTISPDKYLLIDDTFKFYNKLISDIENAKKHIYIETYRFNNDSIGIKFRELLTSKAKNGIEIKLLLDSWGSASVSYQFFSNLTKAGGEIRFFEKIKINFDLFTRSHKRNHRKLIIIDDKIVYIGSSNITEYNLNWKESVLRMQGEIAGDFKRIFKQDYRIYNKYVFDKHRYTRRVKHKEFEIIRDVPSITIKRINKWFIRSIKKAKKSIIIETPYFLPGFLLRKALSDASKKGVEIKVIIPKHSDVGLVDILRNKYIGPLHKNGLQFMYFRTHNLHAKTLLIDKEIFAIGSSNFDYRSFRYMYEILLTGMNQQITSQLKSHLEKTIENCESFDFQKWKRRPLINKIFEWILLPFRHLL